jgi:hypothetical protein
VALLIELKGATRKTTSLLERLEWNMDPFEGLLLLK